MRKTFKYCLHPTPAQERALHATLDECRWLYNRLLEERKMAYEATDKGPTLYGQQATFGALKVERPALAGVHSQVLQNVAVRIDPAFQAFFRRVKAGEKEPGYPRFRGRERYDSFCYPQSGFTFDAEHGRVFLSKIGHVKAVIHRPLAGTTKTCCVRRTSAGKWFVAFSCEVQATPLPATDTAVGIDLGLQKFATLSTGEQIANPRFFRHDERDLTRAQRRLSKEPKPARGERATPERRKRRKGVARIHERIANRRANFAHQESRKVVNAYDVIAVEDLSVNQMAHTHCLSKSIHDAAWRQFIVYLTYKAEDAGRRVVAVNPAYTSQTCSRCGRRQRKELSERIHRCSCCGLILDRDQNAALNILALGLQSLAHA
jgi:putative transposase